MPVTVGGASHHHHHHHVLHVDVHDLAHALAEALQRAVSKVQHGIGFATVEDVLHQAKPECD